MINYLSLIKSAWAFVKKNTWIIWLTIILGLAISTSILYNKNKKLDTTLSYQISNVNQYASLLSGIEEDNRILQLDINTFKNINDSIVHELNVVKEELKIKDKDLRQVTHFDVAITDTLRGVINTADTIIITNDCDFTAEIKAGPFTKMKVVREGIDIYGIPDISSGFDIFVTNKKEYRNKRKNFFDRLVHFDFKKDKISRYQLMRTNLNMKINNVRIIEIK